MKRLTAKQIRAHLRANSDLDQFATELDTLIGRMSGQSVYVGEEQFNFYNTLETLNRDLRVNGVPKNKLNALRKQLTQAESLLLEAQATAEELSEQLYEKTV